MPIPEHEMLGPGFERRLKAALDRVVPPSPLLASARYRSAAASRARRPWRFAPALVGIGAAGMVITAAAATGSPNPAVWKERAGSVIQSVAHFPVASPKAHPSPKPAPSHAVSQGTGPTHPTPSSGHQPPSQGPEPTDRAEPSPRPEPTPSDGRPEPSPTPEPTNTPEPTPTGGTGG